MAFTEEQEQMILNNMQAFSEFLQKQTEQKKRTGIKFA